MEREGRDTERLHIVHNIGPRVQDCVLCFFLVGSVAGAEIKSDRPAARGVIRAVPVAERTDTASGLEHKAAVGEGESDRAEMDGAQRRRRVFRCL